jgi:hypothetical protein
MVMCRHKYDYHSQPICINDHVEVHSGIAYFLFVVTSQDSETRAVTFRSSVVITFLLSVQFGL